MTAPTQPLIDQLAPILRTVAELPLDECRDAEGAAAIVARLEEAWPAAGETFRAVGETLRRGVAEGWLCDRGEPEARFSRVAKATEATDDLSIDVVSLVGPALEHLHPRGEITMAYPAEAAADGSRFDGHPPGWVVMPAGSIHVPTVTGPRMLLLYFLPGGAVEWNPSE